MTNITTRAVPTRVEEEQGFAPLHDAAIPYMYRTRTYYQALGYTTPYLWAHYSDVPFTPITMPLEQSRIALVTTAAPYQPDKGDQGPGAPYNSAAKFYKVYSLPVDGALDLRISHVGIDRTHTTASDMNSWFPLEHLKRLADQGRLAEVAPRVHGAPTNRSHKTTIKQDCPDILERLREDKADAVILVANCPVCHQTISLTARHLEENGIPTVVMGCAKDIVEHVGVPRFLFSDFPLGNAAGKPHDAASQAATLELALDVLETAPSARTTIQSPQRWSENPDWKLDYSNVERISETELAKQREEFARQKDIALEKRVADGITATE